MFIVRKRSANVAAATDVYCAKRNANVAAATRCWSLSRVLLLSLRFRTDKLPQDVAFLD
ncbi:hypothetical protein [Lysinibacillus xylanilyticus]|uniref:hypothetical protein n=1 Tax=Lysinibacillus xylanilyticus TaxID=582475 RepID=UPI003820460D